MQDTMGHVSFTRPPTRNVCAYTNRQRKHVDCRAGHTARQRVLRACELLVCLQSAIASSCSQPLGDLRRAARREADDVDEDEEQEQEPAAPKDRPTVKLRQLSCWLSFIGARPPH